MTVRTAMTCDPAGLVAAHQAAVVGAELARRAPARPSARGAGGRAPSGAPSRGSGYQVSSTVPDGVTVARPTAEAGASHGVDATDAGPRTPSRPRLGGRP